MLNLRQLPKKTYEEWMEESRAKIPIYTHEWTNFNPSDPAVTILETLTAFQMLLQEETDAIPDTVQERLLALLGFVSQTGNGARTFLMPKGTQKPFLITADQRFMAGDISFEAAFTGSRTVCRVTGLFGEDADRIFDFGFVLDRDIRRTAFVFGEHPRPQMKLYFVLDAPLLQNEQGIVWVESDARFTRNPCHKAFPVMFAALRWECYTKSGFVPMAVSDETNGFLTSGAITFTQPACEPAVCNRGRHSGYMWRVTLEQSDYDVAPAVNYVAGVLFPVIQKETLVRMCPFSDSREVLLEHFIPEKVSIRVFGREEESGAYRLYDVSTTQDERGRFYERKRLGNGRYAVRFDKERYGYAPCETKDAVRVVLYNEEMMYKYALGTLYGFDNQEILLPKEHIASESFAVIAQRVLPDGGKLYDFWEPQNPESQYKDVNALSYALYENEGRLVIRDAGAYIGAELFIASLAVIRGEEGNVRAGSLFTLAGDHDDDASFSFVNPVRGSGGAFAETLEDVRRRFAADYDTPRTAVTLSDYEILVKKTPNLCIAKVHAWMDEECNEVQIAVMPRLREKRGKLPETYIRAIMRWMRHRCLLSTRMRIREPVYTAVFVSATVYVKPHYTDCSKQIEQAIRRAVDYIDGPQQFGERLHFDRIFREIETLECVDCVDALKLTPENAVYAVPDGADIVPADDCLLYAGTVRIMLHASYENRK